MRFWDTSALLPLLLEENRSLDVLALLHSDVGVLVWCLCEVEIESALARRVRDGLLPEDEAEVRARLRLIAERWSEVASIDSVRRRAVRLLRNHVLSAADSLQLGAALIACGDRPEALTFVCLDNRLAAAARREGFIVLP